MQFGLSDSDIQQMQEVFAAHPRLKEVLIFGSRAMGTHKPGSDIDLAIVADSLTFDDLLDISSALERVGLLYKIDLLDLNRIKDPDVKDHIQRVGKVFYRNT
jgi:uncharacterized protein